MESSSEIVLLVVVLKVYKYVTKIFWAELTFFARIKFPILCSAANGVYRNSHTKYGISLAHLSYGKKHPT